MRNDDHLSWCPRPPMGWNSWNNYGASVTEAEFLANAEVLAHDLLPYGWDTAVVDIQWYEPGATSSKYRPFADLAMDPWSRLVPAENRFPSAAGGRGFGPLADRVHGLGLKFGLHLMRGIPRQAVHANAPLWGTPHRARDIAHPNSICPWNTDMYGVDPHHPGARAYYRSLFELYAEWGVDFVKIDDLGASRLYGAFPDELALIHEARMAVGRPVVLSLSPGPASLELGAFYGDHANLWRLTDDFWDHSASLEDLFGRFARWAPFVRPGNWPDGDMLPLGQLGLRNTDGGQGRRLTRFTPAEQTSLMTLMAIARSPLILGNDLTVLDEATRALITNPEVIAVNQRGQGPRQAWRRGPRLVWTSTAEDGSVYLGLFNRGTEVDAWSREELAPWALGPVRDLWARSEVGPGPVEVPAQGARLLQARRAT